MRRTLAHPAHDPHPVLIGTRPGETARVGEELADQQLEEWVAQVRAAPPAGAVPDLARLRAIRQRPPGPPLPWVQDLLASAEPAVRVRLYRPSADPLPLVVHVHGGGFVFGDLDSHDRICRRLAQRAQAAVLAVDYRLAPEHPAPAAVTDVTSVVRWAQTRRRELGPLFGDPAVVGDSAGGAIAILAARRLAEAALPLSALLLVCPNADMTLSQPSVDAKGHGWGLDTAALRWFVQQWAPQLAPDVLAQASPLHAVLRGLPTTLVATAEHDPLHDEGAALVRRLHDQHVDAHHLPHPGLVHGFWTLDVVSPAAAAAGDALIDLLEARLPRTY